MLKIKPTQPKIILTLLLFFIILSFAVVIKLISLQVIDVDSLKDKAIKNRQQYRDVKFRGNITDRNGVTLATDITVYDIYAHPRYYKLSAEDIYKKISNYLKDKNLLNKLNKLENSTITLAKNVDGDRAEKIRELKVRGIDIVRKTKRIYPQGEFASHILGYVNKDAGVLAGVERMAKKSLEDAPTMNTVQYDGKGNVIYDPKIDQSLIAKPLKGETIALTIDSRIQNIAEKQLRKAIDKTGADRGTVIVLDPRNGEVLGFSVYPSYNPNEYGKAKLEQHKNWAISDVFPPGSTMKVLTIASALDLGVINSYTEIVDTGKLEIGKWTIKNHDYKKNKFPGIIDIHTLFENSSNVGAVKVGLKMDKHDHRYMLEKFGIGSKTGIELPGESAGILPKKWNKTRQATISFGQGVSVTALQMISAFGAVANQGIWASPHILKYKTSDKNTEKRVISKETAIAITNSLSTSINNSGFFKNRKSEFGSYKIAGKSGTSQKPNPNGKGFLKGQVITSFIGYFPIKNPKIVIAVVLDNPKKVKEAWGSTVAMPVFRSVAEEIIRFEGF